LFRVAEPQLSLFVFADDALDRNQPQRDVATQPIQNHARRDGHRRAVGVNLRIGGDTD
jgi:hypothetical protein